MELLNNKPKSESKGLPAWVMTFADLMTLLMCFFVLLLAFSEIDAQKYKQVAGSMKMAFGVQREIKVKESPKGTSIIAREFSPGRPTPTPLKILRQNTRDDTRQTVVFTDARVEKAKQESRRIREELKDEIQAQKLDVGQDEDRIIIRIREKGSFPSGSAIINPGFQPVLAKISKSLERATGLITVAGHTDDRPISTALYRSNWDLSAGRAVSVVHEVLKNPNIDASRIAVEGHAEADPLVPNDSVENRARNRRVEIIIVQGQDRKGGTLAIDPR